MCEGKKTNSEAMGRMWSIHAIEVDELGSAGSFIRFSSKSSYL